MTDAVRQPGSCLSLSRAGSVHLRIAGLLAIMLVALTIAPVEAGAKRYPKLERFALELVNCTRTGGWVRADGTCKGYGSGRHSRYVAPLKAHPGVADGVAFPWARRIARADYCGHSLAGADLHYRFDQAGFMHRERGENVGCSYGWTPREMVIKTHRMMQSEKSYGGAHWRQMKDSDFKSAGIGVAKVNSKTRIVVDFYGRRPRADG